jgi:hypothetical protein
MSALRIFCDHVEGWQGLGLFLSGSEAPPAAEAAPLVDGGP